MTIINNFITTKDSIFMKDSDADPLFNRVNPLISAVACHKLPDLAILDQKKNLLDLNVVKVHFKNEGRLNSQQCHKLITDAAHVLSLEPNLININDKCYIIGDTHGQYYDLISYMDDLLIKVLKENSSILFLGDYVDRGLFSCETFLYLLLLKSHYPKHIYLLRGNHESEKMTSYFTFKTECTYKYGKEMYKLFLEAFKSLPIAAIVQKQAFCCHGGISPSIKNLADINKIDRFSEIPYEGIFCDLLWSDPHKKYNLMNCENYQFNDQRRTSYFYSYADVKTFLKKFNLKVIIRGHEVQEDGYELYADINGHASVATVFSAPNYCDAYKNHGGIIFYDNGIKNIAQFTAVRHPYVLPGFIDGITWSYPFVVEKMLDFMVDFVNNIESFNSCSSQESSSETYQKLIFPGKLKKDNQLSINMAILRTERECMDELSDEDSTVDCCSLSIKECDDLEFEQAKILDSDNEVLKKSPELESKSLSLRLSPSLIKPEMKSICDKIDENRIERVKSNNNTEHIIVLNKNIIEKSTLSIDELLEKKLEENQIEEQKLADKVETISLKKQNKPEDTVEVEEVSSEYIKKKDLPVKISNPTIKKESEINITQIIPKTKNNEKQNKKNKTGFFTFLC
ncbi:hypothetical protein NUSPORA_02198 [Nucleospora cyclopteri]